MENKPEALVILSPGFPANEADTTCLPPQQLFVKALHEICPGLEIIVLTFQYPFYKDKYVWHGVKVISIGGKDRGRAYRAFAWVKAWQILKKLNHDYTLIGLLSFWLGECAFVGSSFAKRNKLVHYSWLLGQDAKQGNKYFRWIKPKGESLIALSDFVAEETRKNYGVIPIQVIPVGIDVSLFGEAPLKRDIDVLGAGSLIPLKQYHLLVETVAFLKQTLPDIKAVICGKGPDLAALKALVKSKNLSKNIDFSGELPHQEALMLMQRAKIFLHPSNYEGFGAVMSEALYAGAHVVSFVKPMNKDYRHHHVVKTTDEMNAKTLALLKNRNRGHDPVLLCRIEQIAKNMISLFVD